MHKPSSTAVGEKIDYFERLGPMKRNIKRAILNFLVVFVLVEPEGGLGVGFGGIKIRIIFELGYRHDISDF